MTKDIFRMALGDTTDANGWIILRVPGGWIYTWNDSIDYTDDGIIRSNYVASHVFIPLNKLARKDQIMRGLTNA